MFLTCTSGALTRLGPHSERLHRCWLTAMRLSRTLGLPLMMVPARTRESPLVVRPRGVGITVRLFAFEDEALERGWLTLSETATASFVGHLHRDIIQLLAKDRKSLRV